jgi:hypothetical protein
MRRIMTLALMMLIGGYGVAQAQQVQVDAERRAAMDAADKAAIPAEEATETEEATNDFLGLEWGAGIGVIGGLGDDHAVEKASIVKGVVRVEEEGDLRPQVFLEMHVFLGGFGKEDKVKNWRKYQRDKAEYRMDKARGADGAWPTMAEPPLMGFGPFIALQSGDNEVIDALTLGFMWGFRKDPQNSASLNVGIGLSFDPSVQVLGGGLKDGQGTEETEMRFKKEGQLGWALMTSFTF